MRSLIAGMVLLFGSTWVYAGQSGKTAVPAPRQVQTGEAHHSGQKQTGNVSDDLKSGMIVAGPVKLISGQIQMVCLPETDELAQQLADPENRLALVVSSYKPGKNGGIGILVHETGSDKATADPVASIGFFPNVGFGREDTPQKYFLPKYLLRKSDVGPDYCFEVSFDAPADAASKSEADVALEVVTPG